jgi:hypothetical protein
MRSVGRERALPPTTTTAAATAAASVVAAVAVSSLVLHSPSRAAAAGSSSAFLRHAPQPLGLWRHLGQPSLSFPVRGGGGGGGGGGGTRPEVPAGLGGPQRLQSETRYMPTPTATPRLRLACELATEPFLVPCFCSCSLSSRTYGKGATRDG